MTCYRAADCRSQLLSQRSSRTENQHLRLDDRRTSYESGNSTAVSHRRYTFGPINSRVATQLYRYLLLFSYRQQPLSAERINNTDDESSRQKDPDFLTCMAKKLHCNQSRLSIYNELTAAIRQTGSPWYKTVADARSSLQPKSQLP